MFTALSANAGLLSSYEGLFDDLNFKAFTKALSSTGISYSCDRNSQDNLKLLLECYQEDNQCLPGWEVKPKKYEQFAQAALDTLEQNFCGKSIDILYSMLSIPKKTNLAVVKSMLSPPLDLFRTKLPYLNMPQRNQALSQDLLKKEANNLYSKGQLVELSQLQNFNTEEMAQLDIGEEHHKWYSEKTRLSIADPWLNLEQYQEKQITQYLHKKHKVLRKSGFKYSIAKAKQVLFFSKLKTTATSPKFKAEDAFGMDWKGKFGSEIQTSPVAARLYMELGGKYTDLTYTASTFKNIQNSKIVNAENPNHSPFILLLNDKANGDTCENIASYQMLQQCFLANKYHFNMARYVLDHGIIDEANKDALLASLPDQSLIEKDELLGRSYIIFKQISLVLQPDKGGILRAGAAAIHSPVANKDRVERALALLHLWLGNSDVKDDNNRGFLLEDFLEDGQRFVTSAHDLGYGFAKTKAPGTLNNYHTGKKFAKKRGKFLVFKEFMGYRSQAWKQATYADLLWFVHKLQRLSHQQIVDAVASSLWPDFMQELLVSKLEQRKNRILELFDFPQENIASVKDIFIKHPVSGQKIQVIKDGELLSNKKSSAILWLEQNRFPTGLTTRIKRWHDD